MRVAKKNKQTKNYAHCQNVQFDQAAESDNHALLVEFNIELMYQKCNI